LKVHVKLVAHAGKAVAGIGPNGEGTLDVPERSSVADIMARLDVARETLTMALVNEAVVRPALQQSHAMADGDVLTVFPPIEGG